MVRFRKAHQKGITLLEVAVALGVSAFALLGVLALMSESNLQMRARATADRLAIVKEATRNYVRANYTDLVATATAGTPIVIPVGRASASDPVPSGPSGLPSLQGGGFLPSSYVDVNSYNQRHAVLIREPSTNVLEVMITTYGGQDIKDGDLGSIASKVGAEGGFIMDSPPDGTSGIIQGAFGGWRSAASLWTNGTATPEAGHLMATLGFDNGTVLSDFLYRYDIGVPEANRMHTDLDMDGSNIDAVSQLDAETIINNTGDDVEVNDGLSANQGIHIRNDFARIHGNNSLYWEDWGGGLFMQDANWLRSYGSIRTTGTMLAETEMLSPQFTDLDDNTFLVDPNGTSRVETVDATEMYVRNRSASVPVSALLPKYVPQEGYMRQHNETVPKPDCATGGEAKILLSLHRAAWGACTLNTSGGAMNICGNLGGGISIRAVDSGSSWRIAITTINNQINPLVLAQTYCYYP
ncbi:shufflon system plasmid conjugative transfer pilus tip adhesin PilV [Thalassospira xianhensis]|uniref:Bacterial shufflon protein N-terminal domain-containing protein n=1 Tax=Thalassospira xianhensis MCCC 1A02616 TaxID=1177929 RepID=A0A367UIH2_9PROT|nr:shufflon system plasmid conjugative transfer pilus tip adhesin PilV [Thalassospira xianhensis]RCK07821.1 hypothetical protein TH5_01925 [Thalassospira xianhensis MCCC 1A02616]